jgi:hypothetical protein
MDYPAGKNENAQGPPCAATDYSKAQKERYKKGLPNLIYTNGLDFEFIRDGASVDFISIADAAPTLPTRPDSFATLETPLRDFAATTPLSITSSSRLAEIMAGKAAFIKDIMGRALVADMAAREATGAVTDLIGQYEAFKASLIHDITVADFADIMPKPSPMACLPRASMIQRLTVSPGLRRWTCCPSPTPSCANCSSTSQVPRWTNVCAA